MGSGIVIQIPSQRETTSEVSIRLATPLDMASIFKCYDGAFCRFCVLFSGHGAGVGHQPLGKLVKTKFNCWKDAVEVFNGHENTEYHKTSFLHANNLLAVSEKKQATVEIQLNTGLKHQIEENRRRITPVIETIILCGRQGLALRGHRDSGLINTEQPSNENEGNFLALLRYRANGGDDILADHLRNSGKNASYISPHTQNE